MAGLKRNCFSLKIATVAVLIILTVVFQSCDKQKTEYTLVIDNSVVSTDCVFSQNNCFRLPLICVLEEIGIDICWIDDNNAEFQWNGSDYSLSLKDKNLTMKSNGINLITPPPGNHLFICEADLSKREIILDETTLHGVLQLLIITAHFNVDQENGLFRIEIIH